MGKSLITFRMPTTWWGITTAVLLVFTIVLTLFYSITEKTGVLENSLVFGEILSLAVVLHWMFFIVWSICIGLLKLCRVI